jgi:Pentapeptide repeats (8 copies)
MATTRRPNTRPPRWVWWLGAAALEVVAFAALIFVPSALYPPLSLEDMRGVADARSRIELQQAQSRLANDTRTAMLQVIAGILVIAGAAATWRQVYVAREGQITDRYTRAVEQIGSQNVHVRTGGIYAFERIAKNSPADRNSVQFLLASFVRIHADWPVGAVGGPEHPTVTVDEQLPWLRVRSSDVAAAMGVLGRRLPSRDEPILYLSRVDLRCLALRGSRLGGAKLRHTNLARAVLVEVQLDGADLTNADLRQSRLQGSNFTGAILCGATLRGANLTGADLHNADLRGADLREALLDNTVLVGARGDNSTRWPDNLAKKERHHRGVVED